MTERRSTTPGFLYKSDESYVAGFPIISLEIFFPKNIIPGESEILSIKRKLHDAAEKIILAYLDGKQL